jgi:hypothetical protein
LIYSYNILTIASNPELGMLRVSSESRVPLSKVYVKCFAKQSNGQVHFFRDGYTDVRGSFNYFDVKTYTNNNLSSFALFVSDDKHGKFNVTLGCKILNLEAPKNKNPVVVETRLKSKKMAVLQEQNMKSRYAKYEKKK